jgi:hypothetical protein
VDYYETSALLNKNITEVFDKLCISNTKLKRDIVEKQMTTLENEDFRESFQLNDKEGKRSVIEQEDGKKKCC